MTNPDFLIEDPFSGFSGEDKLKAHPKKFQKKEASKIAKVEETPLRNTHTKETRSKKQKMRKREWDKMRCRKEIAESDMDLKARHSIELHLKPFVPTVLQGNVLSQPISPYLRMLLWVGGQFAPHSFHGPFIKRSLKALPSQAMELRRVLLWLLASTKERKKVHIYRSVPHPSLPRKSGRAQIRECYKNWERSRSRSKIPSTTAMILSSSRSAILRSNVPPLVV